MSPRAQHPLGCHGQLGCPCPLVHLGPGRPVTAPAVLLVVRNSRIILQTRWTIWIAIESMPGDWEVIWGMRFTGCGVCVHMAPDKTSDNRLMLFLEHSRFSCGDLLATTRCAGTGSAVLRQNTGGQAARGTQAHCQNYVRRRRRTLHKNAIPLSRLRGQALSR